jgi:regulator of sigma E protease
MLDFLSALPGGALWFAGLLVSFLFVLTIVVFVHELGHFLVGRWCGVEAKIFSIGFGKELFGWTDRHGTRWRIAAVPLGGYVKFAGDADGASTPDFDAMAHMSEKEKQNSFYHKPVGRRAAIVAAGPIANFILAIVIFSATVYFLGRNVVSPRVEFVLPHSAAQAAGIQPGDVFVSVDGSSIESFSDVQRIVSGRAGDPIDIEIDRDGRRISLTATPQQREVSTPFGKQRIGVLGVNVMAPRAAVVLSGGAAQKAGIQPGDLFLSVDGKPIETYSDVERFIAARPELETPVTIERQGRKIELTAVPDVREVVTRSGKQRVGTLGIEGPEVPSQHVAYGAADSVRLGVQDTWFIVVRTYEYVAKLFAGRESTDQLSGPIRIAQVSKQVADTGGLAGLINLAAILSVSIGLINLVPIPLLDGGHLLFFLIEAVRGRPLSERAQEYGFRVGLAIVGLLMIFVTWNDLLHLKAAFGFAAS